MKVLYAAGILLLFLLTMISPAIQIALSASKKKGVWLIMPIFTFICFSTIALLSNWGILLKIGFSICIPIILLVFHILVKKNIFH